MRPQEQLQDSKAVEVIGEGLIGLRWAALFAASGHQVLLYDNSKDPTEPITAYSATEVEQQVRSHDCPPQARASVGSGVKAYCDQFRDSYHEWWYDLGRPKLHDATIATFAAGLKQEIGSRSYQDLRRERDTKLVGVLKAVKAVDARHGAGTPSL